MVDRGAGSVEWMWIMRVSCWFGGRGFMGCVWVLATQRHGVFQNLPTSIRHTSQATHGHTPTFTHTCDEQAESGRRGTHANFHTPGDQTCNLHGCCDGGVRHDYKL